ncbi:hypothetical protein M8C21_015290 [Ambrosia artemisiifolia]|uniref:Uncharacterized protein n=1 Tax=Ambrosia artemisiifolia TaxID=4212 RepID=A0AAD5DIH3_AMBAR|nr:hypothetical protein M8C21_015290 [Ambrosia artemisiifolia]
MHDLYSGCDALSVGLCLGANMVRNESVDSFLLLLQGWEKLCQSFIVEINKHAVVPMVLKSAPRCGATSGDWRCASTDSRRALYSERFNLYLKFDFMLPCYYIFWKSCYADGETLNPNEGLGSE